MPRQLAIFLFDDVEVLDFAGPFEVFSVAGYKNLSPLPFEVFTVAEKSQITARGGLVVRPTYTFENCPPTDIFLIPGGGGYKPDGTAFGSRKEMYNPVVLDWIKKRAKTAELVLSVCTGALILAQAGLLENLKATTHWGAVESLKKITPTTEVIENIRYIDNGKIILSAGVSAGIDMSYYVIERLLGKEIALQSARYAEYDYYQ